MNKNIKWFGYLALVLSLLFLLAACQPAKLSVDPEDLTAVPTEVTQADSDVFAGVYPPEDTASLNMEGALVTESGLQFLEIETSEGVSPQDGDFITMNFIAMLPDGTEFGNSYTQGGPVQVIIGRDQLLPGWEEGVKLMTAGSSARMLLPPELAFGSEGYGMIPPDSQVHLVVELISIEKPPVPEKVAEGDIELTESGLGIYDIEVGAGPEALDGFIVTNQFTIWVKGDSEDMFVGSSQSTQPISFEIGRGDTVFPGWEEGVTNMKVGGKRYLLVPPDLALGDTGGGDIPPGATLILEIELTDVKEPVKMTKVDDDDYTTTESGLKYYDFVEGEGEMPIPGQIVVVHYTGWLEDGTKFDSSLDRGEPFSFDLGAGSVIDGWDEGLATMKVGGKRQLVIPPELGYGDAGAGGTIPPGATLIFEIELLEIESITE